MKDIFKNYKKFKGLVSVTLDNDLTGCYLNIELKKENEKYYKKLSNVFDLHYKDVLIKMSNDSEDKYNFIEELAECFREEYDFNVYDRDELLYKLGKYKIPYDYC